MSSGVASDPRKQSVSADNDGSALGLLDDPIPLVSHIVRSECSGLAADYHCVDWAFTRRRQGRR